MAKMTAVFILGAPLISSLAHAEKSRAPAKTGGIVIEVTYGDRVSKFYLEGPGRRVAYISNYGGGSRVANLPAADYAFFERRAKSLTETDNKTTLCQRRFVKIQSKYGTKTGCLGAPNKLASKMTMIVNLASKYF